MTLFPTKKRETLEKWLVVDVEQAKNCMWVTKKEREIVDKVNLEMSIDGQQIAKPSVFAIFLALYAFLSIHEN